LSWDTRLLISGVFLEVAVAALLTWRRSWRSLPVFYVYILWSLVSDCGMPLLERHYGIYAYIKLYIAEMSLDSLLQYAVIIELAASVLRPYRLARPRWFLPAFALVIILIGIAIWPLTASQVLTSYPMVEIELLRLQQVFAIIRILFFLAMAASSHLFAIGWRDRELQVATGFGLYSLVSLAVSILHAHQPYSEQFHRLDQLVALSYVASLIYWVICFARKPALRRSINPNMERFLATLASTASSQRATLEKHNPRSKPSDADEKQDPSDSE
jgi:heme/copper-type cytochrome/quinol oxidase subunit 4